MKVNIEEIWKKTLAQMEVKLDSRKVYTTWFTHSKLVSLDNKTALIGTHSSIHADFLTKRYKDLITDTLSFVYGVKVKIKIEYEESLAKEQQDERKKLQENTFEAPLLELQEGAPKEILYLLKNSNINPKYSFSNYIVANNNRLAHAAARSIVEKGTSPFNPLFIHGKTGLGKTHLAQAVAREMLEKKMSAKVLYTTSENFLNDLVSAIKTNQAQKFRNKYRELDLLIIDDIQMISNWVETQSEFFNTFNSLHQSGKQVILISDRPPEEIAKLEDRLKSRFQGGLVTDIKEPEFETRIAILEQKKRDLNISIPNVYLKHIAKLVPTNVRELEGALQKIALMSTLSVGHEMTQDEIANILGKTPDKKRKDVKVQDVIKRVADEYGIMISEIKSARRTKETALARQICMYILREEYRYKLKQVANFLNKSDHTTIIHGVDKIKEKIQTEPQFKSQLDKIVRDLETM
ncbi:MAG: chromosomal replication initiator protein DnaA [bacterium]